MGVPDKMNENEKAISRLLEKHLQGLRNKDASSVVECYASENVMFVMSPPLQFTPENAPGKNGLEQWFAGWDGPIEYETRDQKITANDEIGFSSSLMRMHGTKTDGEKVDMWYRNTFCFCQIDGEWKIVHQHESVPFYMDGSARAAVDLKP